jgi:hypothetical protein
MMSSATITERFFTRPVTRNASVLATLRAAASNRA